MVPFGGRPYLLIYGECYRPYIYKAMLFIPYHLKRIPPGTLDKDTQLQQQ